MKKTHHFVDNKGVKIHYILANYESNSVPLVIIPGATNAAEDMEECFEDKLSLPHIIISLRGRGQSDSPQTGYTLTDHVSDVIAVLEQLKVEKFNLFGYSVGGTIGIRVAKENPSKVQKLLIGDFPPFFPPFDKSWADRVLQNPECNISKTALYGLAKDGKYIDISQDFEKITCDVLLIKGAKNTSAFPEAQLLPFKNIVKNLEVEILEESGHDLFSPSPDSLIEKVESFLIK